MNDASTTRRTEAEARALIGVIGPALRGLLADSDTLRIVAFDDSAESARRASRTAATENDALWFEPRADEAPEATVERLRAAVGDHRASTGSLPRVVRVERLGAFLALDEPEQPGRAAGKVAVVTGAAQGFGLEIARDLAGEGARVALLDLNAEAVATAARALAKRCGAERVIGLAADVRRGESIAEAFHAIVRRWGGFDLLVSNAGVLRAESVKTQSEADFDLVTAVNYRGYFLCVKYAAPILALQRRARPTYWSDIVQINSKSGLMGSNRNAAYAGSKFGGIGLTQSFALELVEDGIKVNAVCPGNFFDGPLWSDPANGLFVQYLRAGKVHGARTIEDVRRAYEAKVPMGRGCTAADAMKAIYYLMEQRYETGQALPVTGGQVMLG